MTLFEIVDPNEPDADEVLQVSLEYSGTKETKRKNEVAIKVNGKAIAYLTMAWGTKQLLYLKNEGFEVRAL